MGRLTSTDAEPALAAWVTDPPTDHNPALPNGVFSVAVALAVDWDPPPARGVVLWCSDNSKGPR